MTRNEKMVEFRIKSCWYVFLIFLTSFAVGIHGPSLYAENSLSDTSMQSEEEESFLVPGKTIRAKDLQPSDPVPIPPPFEYPDFVGLYKCGEGEGVFGSSQPCPVGYKEKYKGSDGECICVEIKCPTGATRKEGTDDCVCDESGRAPDGGKCPVILVEEDPEVECINPTDPGCADSFECRVTETIITPCDGLGTPLCSAGVIITTTVGRLWAITADGIEAEIPGALGDCSTSESACCPKPESCPSGTFTGSVPCPPGSCPVVVGTANGEDCLGCQEVQFCTADACETTIPLSSGRSSKCVCDAFYQLTNANCPTPPPSDLGSHVGQCSATETCTGGETPT